MKILFIGGTGVISSACAELALREGIELTLLNRGQTTARPIPPGATVLHGDIRDRTSVEAVLAGRSFDAVVQWIGFTPDHVAADLSLWRGRTGQYVFISSASVYQKPPSTLPVAESTPLLNPFWEYAQQKIACEELLMRAYQEERFPVTIVRPSHTYDATKVPLFGGYTSLHRLSQGRPVIVHGDGTSLWTLTHHRDFAKGFVPLLGNHRALGQAFHITSDEWLTWNQIYTIMADALGMAPQLVHAPSELIAAYDPQLGPSLLGDKAHSMVYDNTKIRGLAPGFTCTIPFSWGAREIVAWYAADPARQAVDPRIDGTIDQVIAACRSIWPH